VAAVRGALAAQRRHAPVTGRERRLPSLVILHSTALFEELEMLAFLLWLLLLILCWPLALLALLLYPLVWLILLPFSLLGIAVEGILELLRALILLPSRVLRGKP
jgi:polyferredoxin